MLAARQPVSDNRTLLTHTAALVPRGRPRKFGRPARPIALTLPDDVIERLTRIDGDVGRAIVRLVENTVMPSASTGRVPPLVELVRIGRRSGLIVVDQRTFRGLPGCRLVPFADGRAFLAFTPGNTLHAFELALVDRLDEDSVTAAQKKALMILRGALRKWRLDTTVSINTQTIVIVEERPSRAGRVRR